VVVAASVAVDAAVLGWYCPELTRFE